MKEAIEYIETVLPEKAVQEFKDPAAEKHLPIYINEGYNLAFLNIYKQATILVEAKKHTAFNTEQLKKHLHLIAERLKVPAILLIHEVDAGIRRRLIQKDIDFVVPGKQMFMPHLMINLNENRNTPVNRRNKSKILPSAQFILLYHLLQKKDNVEGLTFKQLAEKFDYTQMAITKAADDLHRHDLSEIRGTKEKNIIFPMERRELWKRAQPVLVNPVLKKVYVDKLPHLPGLLKCNGSALPEYTDLNPSRQQYYAIGKKEFYKLVESGMLENSNEYEGTYCLEVWKYDPKKLQQNVSFEENVDPLSLYLSLKDTEDERIEMGLEQINENYHG